MFVFYVLSYIDEVVVVSDEKITKNSCLMEVSKAYHVLHPLDGGRVHGLDPPLRSKPLLLLIIVNNLAEK